MTLILILLLAVFQSSVTNYLIENPDYYQLDPYVWESNDFRTMRLGKRIAEQSVLDYDMITTLMIEHDYDLTGLEDTKYNNVILMSARPADYRKLRHAYQTVLGDLKYFPVPSGSGRGTPDVTYEDGWMDGRNYVSGQDGMEGNSAEPEMEDVKNSDGEGGGELVRSGDKQEEKSEGAGKGKAKRRHEGCDIMGAGMPRGYYPVVSITDGIVERIGWLEMGGWRIGIRAPGGAYFYYAHLYGYACEFEEGDKVKAGDLLGYMGDTGYSKIEGTTGNFDVHLHLGIYIRTDHNEEMSINPYWILRYLEQRRLSFSY